MTWVLQSLGVPSEICSKIALMVRKPRHAITEQMLQKRLFMIQMLAHERRLREWFDWVIYGLPIFADEYGL